VEELEISRELGIAQLFHVGHVRIPAWHWMARGVRAATTSDVRPDFFSPIFREILILLGNLALVIATGTFAGHGVAVSGHGELATLACQSHLCWQVRAVRQCAAARIGVSCTAAAHSMVAAHSTGVGLQQTGCSGAVS